MICMPSEGCMMMSDFDPSRVIWSADVSRKKIKQVVDERLLPKGTIIKLDRLFFERYSKRFIDYCQDRGYLVFVDAKIIEIPSKSLEIAKSFLYHKPFMLNIMAHACSNGNFDPSSEDPDFLPQFAKLCQEAGTKSCAVTVLTSKSETVCANEFNGRSARAQVKVYVEMMRKSGLTDIVCSPQEALMIREEMGITDLDINTPGVRLPESGKDDQQRIMTPYGAFKNGVTRIVVGRPLTGNNSQGPFIDRIGPNYGRLIENIQLDR